MSEDKNRREIPFSEIMDWTTNEMHVWNIATSVGAWRHAEKNRGGRFKDFASTSRAVNRRGGLLQSLPCMLSDLD